MERASTGDIRAYALLTKAMPTDKITNQININSENMWKNTAEQGLYLGTLAGPNIGCNPSIDAFINARPYTYWLQMCASPHADRFIKITDMDAAYMAYFVDIMNAFLNNNPNRIVGYNTGEQSPNVLKKSSQTWAPFHLQLLEPHPTELIPVPIAPPRLREPGYQSLERLYRYYFDQSNIEAKIYGLKVVPQLHEAMSNYFTHGTLSVALPNTTDRNTMAEFLLNLDQSYRSIHKDIFSLMVKNYDEVIDTPTRPFAFNDVSDVQKQIQDKNYPDDIRIFLSAMYRNLRISQQVENQQMGIQRHNRTIHKIPTYSVTLVQNNSKTFINFHPHGLREAGSVETLGNNVIREDGDEHTVEQFEQLKANTVPEFERLQQIMNSVHQIY